MSVCFQRAISNTLGNKSIRLSNPVLSKSRFINSMSKPPAVNGDLNNTSSLRQIEHLEVDPAFAFRSLAITEEQDDATIRKTYRPFILDPEVTANDWISKLELSTVTRLAEEDLEATGERLKVLVLYGSLRSRSYSKLLAFEASRILFRLGCDVRVYDPAGLPMKDDSQHDHPKVQELRDLSRWSDGHVWISPEQHGTLTAVFKNQIDWIPLSVGSVRPTQGRTLAIAEVSGGSQSFNAVNALRILGRWMRMFVIPNQSSVPQAYTQFTSEEDAEGGSRMKPSGNRERVVDCMEEFVKFTVVMRGRFRLFSDRFSERGERERKAELERERVLKEREKVIVQENVPM
ncbi:hypothetical protein VTL71DRAFT_12735 [Oculimacula yallundae]|uniref:NADPH-dependent FMN reductase-like domain-containing protein n=1 Tax=Oculimacula yallundae TaxID=86028 RepID=A0ABR4CNV2_9HELO